MMAGEMEKKEKKKKGKSWTYLESVRESGISIGTDDVTDNIFLMEPDPQVSHEQKS